MTTTEQASEVAPLEVVEAVATALAHGWCPPAIAGPREASIVEAAFAARWVPHFPSAELVAAAAALVPTVPELAGPDAPQAEGPRSEFVVAPGALQLRTVDHAKRSRTQERQSPRPAKDADAMAGWIKDEGGLADVEGCLASGDPRTVRVLRGRASTREIREWSRKSRNNMLRTLCQLGYDRLFNDCYRCSDCGARYGLTDVDDGCPAMIKETRSALITDVPSMTPGESVPVTYNIKIRCGSRRHTVDQARLPALVTLLEPADWPTVAPTGKELQRHFRTWRERYRRAWGDRWSGVWKKEFQHLLRVLPTDGRPHFHGHTVTPQGLSQGRRSPLAGMTWQEIMEISRTDPGSIRTCALGGLPFEIWLSLSWAQVVNHPDDHEFGKHVRAGTGVDRTEALKAADPKRLALYFLKRHSEGSGKEYQNIPPLAYQEPGQGPGRFWGTPGMATARVGVVVTDPDRVKVGRVLRRWGRTQGVVRWTWVRRPDESTTYPSLLTELNTDREPLIDGLARRIRVRRTRGGQAVSKYPEVIGLAGAAVLESRTVRYRHSRVRVKRMPDNRGWVSVNDGAAFASQIARWLSQSSTT